MTYVKGPQYASSYSNNIQYAINSADFVFIFGEVIDVSDQEITIEQRARVTMTPAQAKIMSILLKQQVEAYEERLGTEITIPPGTFVDEG